MEPHELNQLIRLAADGEISAEDSARLEDYLAAHPEERAGIAFERDLRVAVGRAMSEPAAAPSGLRESLDTAAHADGLETAVVGHVGRAAWYRPSAMAAGIVILVGVAVAWSVLSHGGFFQDPLTPVEEHIGFDQQQSAKARQLKFTTIKDAQAYLQSNKFGWDGTVPDLSSFGFDFIGSTRAQSDGEGGVRAFLRYASQANPDERLTICIERPLDLSTGRAALILEGHAYQGNELINPDQQQSECFLTWRSGESIMCLIPCDGAVQRELALAVGMPDVEVEPHP